MFYAHSENNEGDKQTMKQHLEKVSELAGQFGAKFEMETECKVMGLFHDLGKYSKRFQGVLEGTEQRVNHEAAGALMMIKLYSEKVEILARCIFGHHKGLENDINSYLKTSLESEHGEDKKNRRYSISGKEEYQKLFEIMNSDLNIPRVRLKISLSGSTLNISKMLKTRMLFSTLVDADYTDTATHYNRTFMERSSGHKLDPEKLLSTLSAYKENMKAKSTSDSKINEIREQIFNECERSAKTPQGLFTLTAPTGTGKTLSLLNFALNNAKEFHKERIIIILPFLAIIEQNAKIYRQICPELLEDHSQAEYDDETKLFSQRWSSPIIITTAVKFFEGLFSYMPSDCRRLHNIANSVIVFDEAQSLPPHLIGVTIETINSLYKDFHCTVLFSTATQPSFHFIKDLEWSPKEILENPSEIYKRTERVKVNWNINEETPFEEIGDKMAKSDSCCTIVNMRKHSKALFELLKEICEWDSLFHISTDMCTEHRVKTLTIIKERLESKLPCRIVSTQCIEAGVDLDVEKVFRALAPLDSIIQSAGRCNRNGKLDYGTVEVFIPKSDSKIYPDEYYEFAAKKVSYLNSKYAREMDTLNINDLKHISAYYELLFTDSPTEDKKLLEYIELQDYEKVDETYKLIKKGGFNVIVPYKEKLSLFNEVKEEALNTGLTPALIAKAQSITVNNYDLKKIQDLCEPVYFKQYGKNRGEKEKSPWYILHEETFYHEKLGLKLGDLSEMNSIF